MEAYLRSVETSSSDDEKIVALKPAPPPDRANYIVEWCLAHGVSANFVTSLRIALTLCALMPLLHLEYLEWAVVLMVLLTLSDILDGQIARTKEKRNPGNGVTKIGKLLDPLSDKVLVIGTLFMMPWVPEYILYSIIALESCLVLVRPIRIWRLKSNGFDPQITGSNAFGQTKTWLEDIMVIAFILEHCQPEHLQYILFYGAMILGSIGFLVHLRLPRKLN